VARITRKELKSDKFALEVGHTVDFFEEHREKIFLYGGVALGVIALIVGYWLLSRHQHAVREEALYSAIQAMYAPVGQQAQPGAQSFPTEQARDQQAIKVLSDVVSKYGGSPEGEIAEYYLGSILANQGRLADAEKRFANVAEKGNEKYASLAKLSLAQIYFADGKVNEGEKTLQDLIAHPTVFVSKDQATISLARQLATRNPAEARKLLQPLLSQAGPVGQVAASVNSEIPQ
jgi:predicted negative regulator of RcsB-dependent stress response